MTTKTKRAKEKPDLDAMAAEFAKLKPDQVTARLAKVRLHPAWQAELLLRLRAKGVMAHGSGDLKRIVNATPDELLILKRVREAHQLTSRSSAIRFCIVSQAAAISPERFPRIEAAAKPGDWRWRAERCLERVEATAGEADHNQSVLMDTRTIEAIAVIEGAWEAEGWDVHRKLNKVIRWAVNMQRPAVS